MSGVEGGIGGNDAPVKSESTNTRHTATLDNASARQQEQEQPNRRISVGGVTS